MPVCELESTLTKAAADVFETMFFTALDESAATTATPDETWVAANLSFRGKPSGTFAVAVPAATSWRLAACFLGTDEDALTREQVECVVCELANMLCGSVLSSVEKDTLFEISSPTLTPAYGPSSTLALATEEGPVAMRMVFDA